MFSLKNSLLAVALLALSTTVEAQTQGVSPAERELRLASIRGDEMPRTVEDFRGALYESRTFAEPIIPTGEINLEETIALYAIASKPHQTTAELQIEILKWKQQFPKSNWIPCVNYLLGKQLYQNGYLSQAIETWEEGWGASKHLTDFDGRTMADANLGELARMYGRIGRMEELEALGAQVQGRKLMGPGAVFFEAAFDGLEMMRVDPGISFKCGPLSLMKIREYCGEPVPLADAILDAASTREGFSLNQVERIANEVGMDYVAVQRIGNAPLPVYSVLHWKVGHFSAIVDITNEKYVIDDPTFRDMLLVDADALAREASGYLLIPRESLNEEFREIFEDEAAKIFGRGGPERRCIYATGPCEAKEGSTCGGSGGNVGMAGYAFHTNLASLNVTDTPIGYAPPVGPSVFVTVTYNQREATQPASFYYGTFGQKWTHNWHAVVHDLPGNTNSYARVETRGGGGELYEGYDSVTGEFLTQRYSTARLFKHSHTPAVYERVFPDGSREVYDHEIFTSTNDGRETALTKIIDAQGNEINLQYDTQNRLISITDAIGQQTTFCYGLDSNDNCTTSTSYYIKKITDPFGRSSLFRYTGSRLAKIIDVVGIESEFDYDTGDFMTLLRTPYGDTTFFKETDTTSSTRWVRAEDPYGEKEFIVHYYTVPEMPISFPSTEIPSASGFLLTNYNTNDRVTLYFDKNSYKQGSNSWDRAKLTNYTMDSYAASRVPEWTKNVHERAVYYNYPGQTHAQNIGARRTPSKIARRLDDGSTQLYEYAYNTFSKPTMTVDPAGRKTHYTYAANDIDLIKVEQEVAGGARETLVEATYNSQHLPLTITDASGEVTTLTYNTRGQILTATNAINQTTTFQYDTDGYLTKTISHDPNAYSEYTYDAFGRIATVVSWPDGYLVSMEYDNLNRPTRIVFPDNTTEEIVYDKIHVARAKDRDGRWTDFFYDAIGQLVATSNPAGEITQYYWCRCGALSRLVDPEGRITTWDYDLMGRVTHKSYPDGTTLGYEYENTTSRLKTSIDSKGQRTNYVYNIDNSINTVSHSDVASGTHPVAPVSFTYDQYYNRVLTMTDGIGTTTYAYNPIDANDSAYGDGMIASIDGPWSSDVIAYEYDVLGRVIERSINGTANVSSVAYDSLGRLDTATNPLGVFTYTYVASTNRLASVASSHGHATNFSYTGTNDDIRLEEIEHLAPGATPLSKFNYEYDALGLITKWTQQAGAATPIVDTMQYDGSLRLTQVARTQGSTALAQWNWRYDKAGNRLSEQYEDKSTGAVRRQTANLNAANQIVSTSNDGPVFVSGSMDEQGKVSFLSKPTEFTDASEKFGVWADSPARDRFTLNVEDWNSNQTTETHEFHVEDQPVYTFEYDANGNTTKVIETSADGLTTTETIYEWDAADQLIAVVKGNRRSEFVYDGYGRRVKNIEKDGSTTLSEVVYIWDGLNISEERDATGATVSKQWFAQGEKRGSALYFYTRDHLASTREVTDANGTLIARYSYDPYGRVTKESGTLDFDFLYTGHHYHEASGLHLAIYRAYDPRFGRWLSRDPIKEDGGINLYAYVIGDPINYLDPDGRIAILAAPGVALAAAGILAIGVITYVIVDYTLNACQDLVYSLSKAFSNARPQFPPPDPCVIQFEWDIAYCEGRYTGRKLRFCKQRAGNNLGRCKMGEPRLSLDNFTAGD